MNDALVNGSGEELPTTIVLSGNDTFWATLESLLTDCRKAEKPPCRVSPQNYELLQVLMDDVDLDEASKNVPLLLTAAQEWVLDVAQSHKHSPTCMCPTFLRILYNLLWFNEERASYEEWLSVYIGVRNLILRRGYDDIYFMRQVHAYSRNISAAPDYLMRHDTFHALVALTKQQTGENRLLQRTHAGIQMLQDWVAEAYPVDTLDLLLKQKDLLLRHGLEALNRNPYFTLEMFLKAVDRLDAADVPDLMNGASNIPLPYWVKAAKKMGNPFETRDSLGVPLGPVLLQAIEHALDKYEIGKEKIVALLDDAGGCARLEGEPAPGFGFYVGAERLARYMMEHPLSAREFHEGLQHVPGYEVMPYSVLRMLMPPEELSLKLLFTAFAVPAELHSVANQNKWGFDLTRFRSGWLLRDVSRLMELPASQEWIEVEHPELAGMPASWVFSALADEVMQKANDRGLDAILP